MNQIYQLMSTIIVFCSLSLFAGYILTGNWLKRILLFIVFPVGIWITGAAGPSTPFVLGNQALTLLTIYFIVALIVLIASKWQKRIAATDHLKIGANRLYTAAIAKPEKTVDKIGRFLTDEKMMRFDSVVNQFLVENKPFLRQKYSLRELASDVDIPMNYLSAFINRYHKMNYNDFINGYRVTHSKNIIIRGEWKQKTLEAIGFESGFNNRNTFTMAFKKEAGISPVEYLQSIKKSKGEKIIMSEITKPLSKAG